MNRSARIFDLMVCVCALAACAASALYPPGAVAQPATVQRSDGEEFRPVYASAADVAEGKRVAEAACVRCHGAHGISVTPGIPHLAAQRAAYLYLELRAYQSGKRPDKTMDSAVRFLSEDALIKVAAYYASVEPARPRVIKTAKRTESDPVAAGRAMAAGCAGCHGENGVTQTPGMPSLVGQDPKYLIAAMKAYKNGQRKHDMMKSLLAALGDADFSNVALHYALQKPARAKTQAAGNAEAGKSAAGACAGCHGELGVSAIPTTPSLAGQDAQYFAAAIKAYKDGSRKDETMKGLAAALDDSAVKNLAAFYARQQPRPPKVRKPLTTAEWAARCDRCHGLNGNSTDPRLPALAAQRVDYLEKVLHAYRKGERKSPAMAAMSEVLTEADVEKLAAHYARQNARAVVYVTLPSK